MEIKLVFPKTDKLKELTDRHEQLLRELDENLEQITIHFRALTFASVELGKTTVENGLKITDSQQLEEIATEICDKYCKYPEKYRNEEKMFGEACDQCPLDKIWREGR